MTRIPAKFGPYQVDAEVKEQAMQEFENSWLNYTSPTAAAVDVARRWEVGKTTLVDWLRSADRWPTQRTASLQREVMRLRAMVRELGGHP